VLASGILVPGSDGGGAAGRELLVRVAYKVAAEGAGVLFSGRYAHSRSQVSGIAPPRSPALRALGCVPVLFVRLLHGWHALVGGQAAEDQAPVSQA
jgi:hypothetical protein